MNTISAAPNKSLAVQATLDDLDVNLATLTEVLDQLGGRLHPVLEPTSPKESGITGEASRSNGVPIAEQIERAASRVETLTRIARDLVARLHV